MFTGEKLLVERRFRVPAGPGEPKEALLTWQDLESEHIVVVLGEPGSGKSTEFEREASRQAGAVALSIRRFLRAPLDSADLRSKILFLDALDEMRSGPNRHEVLDSVIQRIEQLDRPKVRLSCRAADWFGDLDRSELASVSPSGEVQVVELLPLTEEEVVRIVQAHLGDPSEFLARVRQQRLESWLGNPQTLELMIKVEQEGRLPETRSELFEKACALMADEENRTHRQARQAPIGRQQILETAGFLCALTLIAGLGGFAGDRADSEMDFPPIDEIPGSLDEFRAAIGTRLFRWQEGRATPVHRTIAEFLAARALRGRLAAGLPLARVLRMITGFDGGTLSDLRGLYAWLTTVVPQHAPYLASRDPVALIFYGDPEPLSPYAKRVVLNSIEQLADRDPWFFYEGSSVEAFGGLADPALIPDFRSAILEPNRPYFLRLSVLSVIAYGHPLPDLSESLGILINSPNFPEGLRELALEALANVVNDKSTLLPLLADIQTGKLADPDDDLRARLLDFLYPDTLGPKEIANYLLPPKSQWKIGHYCFFLTEHLIHRTPPSSLPSLLNSFSRQNMWTEHREHGVWADFVGPLLVRTLISHGESAPPHRIWAWLQLGQDEYGMSSVLNGEHQVAIRNWFSQRPEQAIRLYQWWVQEGPGPEFNYSNHAFWGTLCMVEIPSTLYLWQLSMVEAWTGESRGEDLFRTVVRSMWEGGSHPTLDEIYAWVNQHPQFKEALLSALAVDLPNRYSDPDRLTRLQERRSEKAARKAKNLDFIKAESDRVRTGEAIGVLEYLAKLFLSPSGSAGSSDGLARIEQEFGPEVASIASEGFLAVLNRSDIPSPGQVGELAAQQKCNRLCYPLLVGIILLEGAGTLPDLGESPVLRTALAFVFSNGIYGSESWIHAAIASNPKAAAEVAQHAWKPLLDSNAENIPYLYRVDRNPSLVLIAREIGKTLLSAYPSADVKVLRELMKAALVGSSNEDLIPLALEQLNNRRVLQQAQYILWLAFALLITPEEGHRRVKTFFRRGNIIDKTYQLTDALDELNGTGVHSLSDTPTQTLEGLVRILGTICHPQSPPADGWVGRHDSYESSQLIGRLIDILGNRIDDESVSHLRALRDSQALAFWKDKLAHTAEQQRRKLREARYQRPSLPDVIKVLENGSPTSLPDLHAVVCDHLRTLKAKIENGPESEYRTFWNVGPKGELQSPVPENEARNRLRFILNDRLKPLGISAEIEPHYAHGKRGDLKMIYGSMNIPLEAKRHFHREVWIAPRTQLKRKYSIDPGAGGFGIYLVFWFGLAKDRQVPTPLAGIVPPSTASEMEAALRQIYSGEEWQNIEFICIDCSARETETQKRKRRTQRSSPRRKRSPGRQKGN